MSEITMSGNGFIGYEYKDITVRRELEPLYVDNYGNFGWKLDSSAPAIPGIGSVTLKFKRDRRIKSKNELNRLQRQFDSCMAEIARLEGSKTTIPSIWAYTVGLIGTAFMAGSVFAVIAPNIPLCIILAIPAFAGWGAAYLLYRQKGVKQAEQVAPLIDHQFNMIYEACEQAHALLA